MTSEGAALWARGWQQGFHSTHPPHRSKQHTWDPPPPPSAKAPGMKKTQTRRSTAKRNARDRSSIPVGFGNSKLGCKEAAPIHHCLFAFRLSFLQRKCYKEQRSTFPRIVSSPEEPRFPQPSVETLQALPLSTSSRALVTSSALWLFSGTFLFSNQL